MATCTSATPAMPRACTSPPRPPPRLDRVGAGVFPPDSLAMAKKLIAELLGTFWLVLGGCGSAVLAANFGGEGNPLGIGLVGVALAFGLTVLTGAYALGRISGGHFNPAVSAGLWAGGRFPTTLLLPYILAQTIGAILAAAVLWHIAHGR